MNCLIFFTYEIYWRNNGTIVQTNKLRIHYMKDFYTEVDDISKDFAQCSKFLTVIGDETR